jgi:hypothetical protein
MEQKRNPAFTEECLSRINNIPDYSRIKSFNISKQVEDMKTSFKDLKNIKVMKIIEGIFNPKKELVHSKHIRDLGKQEKENINEESLNQENQNQNYDEEDNDIIAEQIENLLNEMKNKHRIENISKTQGSISKTGSSYIKPSANHSKFMIGQRLNKTFNLMQQKKVKDSELRENSNNKCTTRFNHSVITQESVPRSTSMPSRTKNTPVNTKNTGKISQNGTGTPNKGRKVVRETSSSEIVGGSKTINKTEYNDLDVELALENNQIGENDMNLLSNSPTKKNILKTKSKSFI